MKVDNIDKFGNCVFCHRNLVKNVVLNGKIDVVFDADRDHIHCQFNNGSYTDIPVCKPCKKDLDFNAPDIREQIMEQVKLGWELEIDHMDRNAAKFQGWNEKAKKSLKDYYETITDYTYIGEK